MEYKNPAATVDIIVEIENKLVLIKRKSEPYKGCWAIPGGFLNCGKENLEQAAARELKEETDLQAVNLKLIAVYSNPNRDPRGHIISHVYAAKTRGKIKAGDDAKEIGLFEYWNLPKLAFDHDKIIYNYIKWKKTR